MMNWRDLLTMKQRLHIIILLVVAILVGCTGGDTKNEEQVGDFNQIMHQADSLYNSMEFRTAYDLYLQLLDNKEAKADDEKMLNVLNSLCMASELAGHKAEQTKWMQQLLDLAKQTGNAYYESLGLLAMGKRIYYEGDRQQGIHARDYFIMDYLRERGRYPEAVKVYDDLIRQVREYGDTLGEMMNSAKWGLAEVYQKMGNYKQAADLYVQVLEINDTLKARQA